MARLVALVFTWWNISVSQLSPMAHREGPFSRPVLLHGVARRLTHSGKTILRVTSIHAKADKVMAGSSALTQRLKAAAQAAASQLTTTKPDDAGCAIFINADLIAAGLSPFRPEAATLQSMRLMVEAMRDCVAANRNFSIETTLGGR